MDEGFAKLKRLFSDVDDTKKPSSTLRHDKKVQRKKVSTRKVNQSSLSPICTSKNEEKASHEASEQHLARTFSPMTSVLEGFNTKLKSHTGKKSVEILSSALDKIHMQLQAVESQIQADAGKLASVGKSKRKRLESTFQEQHERLRLLHDKFKKEANQHIMDCRSTLDEMDAYQVELKGLAERQKASHRKLINQAEEAMKVQLSDAETCVAAVDKEARKRMNGIKEVLDEWMADIC